MADVKQIRIPRLVRRDPFRIHRRRRAGHTERLSPFGGGTAHLVYVLGERFNLRVGGNQRALSL